MSESALTQLLCPITLGLPIDPVIAEDGNVYERSAIEAQLKIRLKSPLTNEPMGHKLLTARHVTNVIESFIEARFDDDRLSAWQTAKNASDAALNGWIHLVDLFRTDLKLTKASARLAKKPLKRLLEIARRRGYHGVLQISYAIKRTAEVCFVKFARDATFTASDFLNAGDFSCHLYLDKTWKEKFKDRRMPPDPHPQARCPCRTAYMKATAMLDCTACGQSFHMLCTNVLCEDDAKWWRCVNCAE
jgi:hypothetical protein